MNLAPMLLLLELLLLLLMLHVFITQLYGCFAPPCKYTIKYMQQKQQQKQQQQQHLQQQHHLCQFNFDLVLTKYFSY